MRLSRTLLRALAAAGVPALAAGAVLTAARPARAALVTDVADAADGQDPIDINIDVQWRRTHRRGKITREAYDRNAQDPAARVTKDVTELFFQRWTHVMDATVTFGLFHDLEVRGKLPYALWDEQYWDYSHVGGYVKPVSTIENNRLDPDNSCLDATCTTTRPLLASPGRVYRGGMLDPSVGISWGPLNDYRDEHLPARMFPFKNRSASLVLGFDYTMPVAPVASPLATRDRLSTDPLNPQTSPASVAGLGLGTGAHKFDWWVSMSKRLGIVEPFLRLHYTLPVASDQAFDNCTTAKADADGFLVSGVGHKVCAGTLGSYWNGKTGLMMPHRGGVLVGTEIVPVEEKDHTLRLAVGLMGSAEYVSKGRGYSELSDALHKLTYTDQYFELDGRLVLDLRFTEFVHLVAGFSMGTETPHYVTNESIGKDWFGENPTDPPDGRVMLGTAEQNPVFDFRLDQPGRRFRVTGVWTIGVSTMLSVNF